MIGAEFQPRNGLYSNSHETPANSRARRGRCRIRAGLIDLQGLKDREVSVVRNGILEKRKWPLAVVAPSGGTCRSRRGILNLCKVLAETGSARIMETLITATFRIEKGTA